jgi:hypothetical protein
MLCWRKETIALFFVLLRSTWWYPFRRRTSLYNIAEIYYFLIRRCQLFLRVIQRVQLAEQIVVQSWSQLTSAPSKHVSCCGGKARFMLLFLFYTKYYFKIIRIIFYLQQHLRLVAIARALFFCDVRCQIHFCTTMLAGGKYQSKTRVLYDGTKEQKKTNNKKEYKKRRSQTREAINNNNKQHTHACCCDRLSSRRRNIIVINKAEKNYQSNDNNL